MTKREYIQKRTPIIKKLLRTRSKNGEIECTNKLDELFQENLDTIAELTNKLNNAQRR